MKRSHYNKLLKHIKKHFLLEQKKYLEQRYSERFCGHIDYEYENEFKKKFIIDNTIKIRLCGKRIFKKYNAAANVRGFFSPWHKLFLVDSNSNNIIKILVLIHEGCHMIDFYEDFSNWPHSGHTYLHNDGSSMSMEEVIVCDFNNKVEREQVAFSNTVEFINDEIEKVFSKKLFKELKRCHEEFMKKLSQGHEKDCHAIACRNILTPQCDNHK